MGRESGRLGRRRGGRKPKAESRKPKEIRSPKSEIRKGNSAALGELTPGGSNATANGGFARQVETFPESELSPRRTSVARNSFRISDFGFSTHPGCRPPNFVAQVFQPAVAQIFNLRISPMADGLPNEIRQYGRLKTCATSQRPKPGEAPGGTIAGEDARATSGAPTFLSAWGERAPHTPTRTSALRQRVGQTRLPPVSSPG